MPLTQPFQLPWPLAAGDRVPAWTMQGVDGRDYSLGDFVGRPLVLLFSPLDEPAVDRPTMNGFGALLGEFQQAGANVVAVSPGAASRVKALADRLGSRLLHLTDADGKVTVAHHAVRQLPDGSQAAARKTFLIDPNLRVLRIYEPAAPAAHAGEVLEAVRAFVGRDAWRHVAVQAPVLLVPNVLSPEFCRELIRVWETQGNEDSGFMVQRDGQTVGVLDYGHKIRRDHFLQDGDVKKRVMYSIFHRVKPEIQKAYNFEVSRFEDFRIVCYDAAKGGYFRPHRDNTTTGTAHRVWAMTLNLNVGEYEGGYLRFSEFGSHLYRPETGGAVIFSCSLLHEATDITSGRRFALLSFFYGEREAQVREENARRAGTGQPPSR